MQCFSCRFSHFCNSQLAIWILGIHAFIVSKSIFNQLHVIQEDVAPIVSGSAEVVIESQT
jgi:hypothetical protein